MPRPKHRLITRDGIMRTALWIVDEHGAEALSVTRIAAELGVKGPSMYNHIGSRSDILDGLRELLVEEMDLPVGELRPWTRAMDRWARAYRAAFAAHPRLVPLLAAHPIKSPAARDAYAAASAMLREAGWPESELLAVIRAVDYLVVGSAMDLITPTRAEVDHAFDVGLTSLIAGLEQRLREHQEAARR